MVQTKWNCRLHFLFVYNKRFQNLYLYYHMVQLAKSFMSGWHSKLRARVSRAFTFKRIQVNQNIIHSKSYLNISQRNSSTVYVNDLGFVEVKLFIKVFVQCQNALFCSDPCSCKHPSYYGIADCCLQPAADITLSSDNFTNCKPGHTIPVRRENCSNVIFSVTSITALCILVDCKSGH